MKNPGSIGVACTFLGGLARGVYEEYLNDGAVGGIRVGVLGLGYDVRLRRVACS